MNVNKILGENPCISICVDDLVGHSLLLVPTCTMAKFVVGISFLGRGRGVCSDWFLNLFLLGSSKF